MLSQGAKIPCVLWPKNQNIKNNIGNVVTNSRQTLNIDHIEKVFKTKQNKKTKLFLKAYKEQEAF